MKKMVILILAVLAVTAVAQYDPYSPEDLWRPYQEPEWTLPEVKVGDINKDGRYTDKDLQLIQYFIDNVWMFDVDGNNKINKSDIKYLQNHMYNNGAIPVRAKKCRSVSVERPCSGDKTLSHSCEKSCKKSCTK